MAPRHQTHDDLTRRHRIVRSSDRAFGILFVLVFCLIGLFPVLNGGAPNIWALTIAALLALVTSIRPSVLAPLNRVWFRFGLVLNRMASVVVFGLIFLVGVVPTAVAMRLAGKDLLRLKPDPEAKSYWIEREHPSPDEDSLKNQF